MSVSSITTAVKTRVAVVLGNTYKELGYAIDITKNSFKNNDKRYAVLPKSISEQSGILGHITVEQDFDIILTDGFINQAMSDSQQQNKTIALQDLLLSVYTDLVKTKCGAATCINVSNLSVSDPQFIDNDKVIVMTATFRIKYRNQL